MEQVIPIISSHSRKRGVMDTSPFWFDF